jgi:hypothetical protein
MCIRAARSTERACRSLTPALGLAAGRSFLSAGDSAAALSYFWLAAAARGGGLAIKASVWGVPVCPHGCSSRTSERSHAWHAHCTRSLPLSAMLDRPPCPHRQGALLRELLAGGRDFGTLLGGGGPGARGGALAGLVPDGEERRRLLEGVAAECQVGRGEGARVGGGCWFGAAGFGASDRVVGMRARARTNRVTRCPSPGRAPPPTPPIPAHPLQVTGQPEEAVELYLAAQRPLAALALINAQLGSALSAAAAEPPGGVGPARSNPSLGGPRPLLPAAPPCRHPVSVLASLAPAHSSAL